MRSPSGGPGSSWRVPTGGAAGIGRAVGCTAPAARDATRAFEADGLAGLTAKPKARKNPGRVWDRERGDDLRDLPHRRPRALGTPTTPRALALVAEVRHAKGRTRRVLSAAAIRQTLRRLGVGWGRAKHWITSPGPAYAAEGSCGTG